MIYIIQQQTSICFEEINHYLVYMQEPKSQIYDEPVRVKNPIFIIGHCLLQCDREFFINCTYCNTYLCKHIKFGKGKKIDNFFIENKSCFKILCKQHITLQLKSTVWFDLNIFYYKYIIYYFILQMVQTQVLTTYKVFTTPHCHVPKGHLKNIDWFKPHPGLDNWNFLVLAPR